jgi:prepilin signal peptidase PulO-like enzyme (type II secretory pathway)
MIVVLAIVAGFCVGVAVNLLADYLSASRHYNLARSNPFVSKDVIPPAPKFFPQNSDGQRLPIYLWSGVVAALLRQGVFKDGTRGRHVITEIGLALAYAWISNQYQDQIQTHLGFLLFYAAVFALIVVIDTEHRWILFETIWPPALVAIFESIFFPRVSLPDSLRGGLYGFVILYGLYVLGLIFARGVSLVTGRRVGRTVLGFGDVRMGMLAGLILGWGALGPALLLMILSGAVAAAVFIIYKVGKTRRYRIFSAIPYGPYIVLGTAIMLYAPWIMGDLMAFILHRRYGM